MASTKIVDGEIYIHLGKVLDFLNTCQAEMGEHISLLEVIRVFQDIRDATLVSLESEKFEG